jgi:NAD(P)-dependent dehydrogenase (short-subunit alcohol dehydrogenase family)
MNLEGHVVVVTGASSGIGRLTALRLAQGGAHVVAAARNQQQLELLAEETAGLPGSVLPVTADVSDIEAVRRLRDRALEVHGRIDTWMNVAGIAVWAKADETTPEEYRRVVEVNFLGVVHGTLAALEVMKLGWRGTIINVGSVESRRAMPLQAAYAASKHAVKGFTEAVRSELEHEGCRISVCLVMPSAMNTPIFRHARSRLGVLPRPFPPVYEPDVVADALVRLTMHPVDRVLVGGAGAGLALLERLSPRLTDRLVGGVGQAVQRSDQPDDGIDNLEAPIDEVPRTRDEWPARSWSGYTSLIALRPMVVRVGVAAVAAIAVLRMAARRR